MKPVQHFLVKVTLFNKASILIAILFSIVLALSACSAIGNNQQKQSKRINAVSQQLLYLWDDTPAYLTYEKYSTFTGAKGNVIDVTQIGQSVLIIDDQGNLRAGDKLIAKIPGRVDLAKFSPNKKFLAVGEGLTINVYDTLSGESVGSLVNHRTRISSLEFSQDSKLLLIGGSDSRVYLWKIEEQAINGSYENKHLELYSSHSSVVSAVSFKDDTYFLSGDWAGALKLWKVYDKISDNVKSLSLSRFFIAQKAVYDLEKIPSQVLKTYILGDYFYTLDDLGSLSRWSFQGLKKQQTLELTEQTKVISADFFNNKLIVSGRSGKLSIWVLEEQIIKTYDEVTTPRFVKFLNDQQIFVVDTEGHELIVEL